MRSNRHAQVSVFAATWLAYMGYYFCRKAYYVVKATLGETFGLDAYDLGLLGSTYLIAYAVGQFFAAYLGHRSGAKRLLLLGMMLSLLCNLGLSYSNSFSTLALFLGVNGLAQGSGWSGCIGSLAHWFGQRNRAAWLGVWSTCYQLGSVFAKGFAAYQLGEWGWRWSFFGSALILLAIWGIVLYVHPGEPREHAVNSEGNESASTPESNEDLGWDRRVLEGVLLMGSIYFCIKFLRYALWSWTPYLLQRNFGLSGENAGYLSTVFDLCGFVGVIAAGLIADRYFARCRNLLALSMLVGMAVSYLLLYYFGTFELLYFALCLGLIGFFLYGPDSLIAGVGAMDITTPRGALVAAGVINGLGSLGPIIQEWLVGWMYVHFKEALLPIFLLFLGVACLSVILCALLSVRLKPIL